MTYPLNADLRFSIVPEWVLDAEISDRALRVYTLLARYADSETLQAFPSRETLAKRARCHWRSIDRAIDELVQIGAITKTHRKSGESYQSNLYTLKRVPPHLSRGTDTGVTRVLTPQSLGTDTGGNLTITTERELENDKVFDQFWTTYPRKVGKGAARKAFDKALKTVSAETILAGAERLANDPNKPSAEYLPHAATWLSGDRWDDEPYPARQASGGQFVRPPAEGPGRRDWVRALHEAGEHFACGPGEFGH